MVPSGLATLQDLHAESTIFNTIIVTIISHYQPQHFLCTHVYRNSSSKIGSHHPQPHILLCNPSFEEVGWGNSLAPLTVRHAVLPLLIVNGFRWTPRGEAISSDAREVSRPLVDERKDTWILLTWRTERQNRGATSPWMSQGWVLVWSLWEVWRRHSQS